MIFRQTRTELFDCLAAELGLLTFMQCSIAFGSRPEAANDVISRVFVRLVVSDQHVKYRDPARTVLDREIQPKSVGYDIIFGCFQR